MSDTPEAKLQAVSSDGRQPYAEPWAAVMVLTTVGFLNYLDRSLPSILAEPIRRDLALSDTAWGLINGFGFLLVYAIAGIPIARIADRGRYGVVIAGSLAFWSAMTLIGGFARNSWMLAVTRMGVAVGEAGSTPSAHAFISRNFKPERRAAALSVLTLAVPMGQMGSFVIGGYLASILGWRNTFIVTGMVGLLISPLVYIVLRRREHKGERSSKTDQNSRLTNLFRIRSFRLIMAGTAFIYIGGNAAAAFAPAFLMRIHHMTVAETGLKLGILSGILCPIVLIGTAWAADRLARRDSRWTLGVVALVLTICLPFGVAAFMAKSSTISYLSISVIYAAAAAYLAPVVTALHRLVPAEMRARSSAMLLFCGALAGGIGPFLVGIISDYLRPGVGDISLGYGLLVVPVTFAIAALFYVAATTTYRDEMVAEV